MDISKLIFYSIDSIQATNHALLDGLISQCETFSKDSLVGTTFLDFLPYIKMYADYCKIYNNGILIRDFIPCEYEGVFGLWDKVTNQFFANNGTGEFVAGPYSLIGKTVSKINGKTVSKINGISVQCWKKKDNS